MCLITYQKTPFKANKGINVFKVLYRPPGRKTDKLISPYYTSTYKIGVPRMRKSIKALDDGSTFRLCVFEGFHAYSNIWDAISAGWMLKPGGFPIICQAVIPKGSLYFESYNGRELASNQLLIEKALFDIPYVPLIYSNNK